jgi:sortase B
MAEKRKNKALMTILTLVAAAVLIVCTVSIVNQVRSMQQQRELDAQMSDIARPTPEDGLPTSTPAPSTSTEPGEPSPGDSAQPSQTVAPVPQEIDFDALKKENGDIFSWITLEGTVIDYPVLCRPEDDAYYHTHNVAGKTVTAGAIYIQGSWNKTDWSDFHTVIYGHNMRNGSMFAALHKFEDRAFFDEHDKVVIYTPTKRLTYTIFAAYKRDDAHLMKKFHYDSEEGRQAFIDEIYSHTSGLFREGVEVTPSSNLITLSTCVGGQDDKRFVVQAVLTESAPVIGADAE